MNFEITASAREITTQTNLRVRKDTELFDPKKIVVLIANVNYTYIYLQCGRVVLSAQTLKKFDAVLSKIGFVRVNKSALINPQFLDSRLTSELTLKNGLKIQISRRRKTTIGLD